METTMIVIASLSGFVLVDVILFLAYSSFKKNRQEKANWERKFDAVYMLSSKDLERCVVRLEVLSANLTLSQGSQQEESE